jgi:arginase
MEERLVSRLIQVGIRATTAHQIEQQFRFGVSVLGDDVSGLSDLDPPIYLSLDMDGLDPAFAPGVAHPEPGGLSTREVLRIIQSLRGKLVAADIVEYCPPFDSNGATARVAAKLLKEIAAALATS